MAGTRPTAAASLGIAHIVRTLGSERRSEVSAAPGRRPGTHAAKMISALADGEMSSRQLAELAGVPSKQVLSILRHAISIGLVSHRVDDKRGCWFKTRQDFDAETHARLKDAAALLRRHGFIVRRPR